MASSAPLVSGTIEADEDAPTSSLPKGNIGSNTSKQREPVVLVPGTTANGSARTGHAEQGGIVSLEAHI